MLALLLLNHARRLTRTDPEGRLLLLEEQDRSLWDRAAIVEGNQLVVEALRSGFPGKYRLQAAIAAPPATAPTFAETDWPRILTSYDQLLTAWPSPVAAHCRAVSLCIVSGPLAALREIEELERDGRLAGYRYLPSVKADFLRRMGRHQEAASAYRQAINLTENAAKRAFLARRLAESTDKDG